LSERARLLAAAVDPVASGYLPPTRPPSAVTHKPSRT